MSTTQRDWGQLEVDQSSQGHHSTPWPERPPHGSAWALAYDSSQIHRWRANKNPSPVLTPSHPSCNPPAPDEQDFLFFLCLTLLPVQKSPRSTRPGLFLPCCRGICPAFDMLERSGTCLCPPWLQKPPDWHLEVASQKLREPLKHSGSIFVRVLSSLKWLRAWVVEPDWGSMFSSVIWPQTSSIASSGFSFFPYRKKRINTGLSRAPGVYEVGAVLTMIAVVVVRTLWSFLPFCPSSPPSCPWCGAGMRLCPQHLVLFQLLEGRAERPRGWDRGNHTRHCI